MDTNDRRTVLPGFWIERVRAWQGSPHIMHYAVYRQQPAWDEREWIGRGKTVWDARRIVRGRQAFEVRKAAEDAEWAKVPRVPAW